jgi:predicted metal-dependent HD superfamily phosphohydrolase
MEPGALDRLRAEWDALLGPFGCSADARRQAFADLVSRYGTPDRHYHTLRHIASVLDALPGDPVTGEHAAALRLAAWFHDAVYDTRADDNEQRSAASAGSVLRALAVPECVVKETGRLILLTKTHRTTAADTAGKHLIDADLAVFGAPVAEYDAYAGAIRREYAWVPEAAYRAGRRRVLERFLGRTRIYLTEGSAGREEVARRNLARELAALGAGG